MPLIDNPAQWDPTTQGQVRGDILSSHCHTCLLIHLSESRVMWMLAAAVPIGLLLLLCSAAQGEAKLHAARRVHAHLWKYIYPLPLPRKQRRRSNPGAFSSSPWSWQWRCCSAPTQGAVMSSKSNACPWHWAW